MTDANIEWLIVVCQDTDVLVMLTTLCSNFCSEVWIKAGTSKDPNFIAVHMIWFEESLRENMMAFHALTGCNTTSQFSGTGKKSAWSVFKECPILLKHLGEAEQFVCKLYQHSTDKIYVNELRYILFNKVDAKIEKLLPTKDAQITQHIRRVNYQTMLWRQCLDWKPELPSPLNSGWELIDNQLKPVLFTQDPVLSCNNSSCICNWYLAYCILSKIITFSIIIITK